MKSRALTAAALLGLFTPAHAWHLFGEPSDGRIQPVQALSDAERSTDTLSALTPEFIQSLRGTDLRQAYILLGDNLERIGRPDKALGEYQLGVSLFPANVDLLTRQASLLHRNGLDEQAKPLFERALKIEAKHWGAHLGLAEIDRRMRSLDRAAEHYRIALEAPDVARRSDVRSDYAQVLLEIGDAKSAEATLSRALEISPGDAGARILLGQAHRAEGRLDDAAADFESAASVLGVGALRAEALALLEGGRLAQARRTAMRILAKSPEDPVALWVEARIRLSRGDPRGAAHVLAPLANGDGFISRAAAVLRHKALQLADEPHGPAPR